MGTGLGATERVDRWWIGPLLTGIGFAGFIVYSTFRAFYPIFYSDTHGFGDSDGSFYIGEEFSVGDEAAEDASAFILSPMYSPLFRPDWMKTIWFPISPAFLILWVPGGFRVTCYYYRKAYYRAYFLDPPGCAVGEPQARGARYSGETRVLLFQNLHRFFMYLAVALIFILSWDAIEACIWPVVNEGVITAKRFGMSVGTVVLGVNACLLGGYTFGCHSFRHLVGGKIDCFSCEKFGQTRFRAWRITSLLNAHHMQWAWVSLFFVGFTDLYVWMVASGRWTDFPII